MAPLFTVSIFHEFQNDPDSGIDSSDKKSHRKRKRKESLESHETSKRFRLDGQDPSGELLQHNEDDGLTRKKKKKKDKHRERPEMEEDVEGEGQLVSQIEIVEHKIDVEDVMSEEMSKKEKKKKKKEKERERAESEILESMIDIVEPKLEVDDEAPPAMTSEKEKKKHKKDKERTDLVRIKPDPDGPSQFDGVPSNSSKRPKPFVSAAVVKQEPGLSKKSREAELLDAQRQQLIADMLSSKPKKGKKTAEPEVLTQEKRKKKGANVTMVVDGDPSFLVPTSTPVPRVEESRDLLITNMMAKFNKKSKKLNNQ